MEGESVEHVYIIKEGTFSIFKNIVSDILPDDKPSLLKQPQVSKNLEILIY